MCKFSVAAVISYTFNSLKQHRFILFQLWWSEWEWVARATIRVWEGLSALQAHRGTCPLPSQLQEAPAFPAPASLHLPASSVASSNMSLTRPCASFSPKDPVVYLMPLRSSMISQPRAQLMSNLDSVCNLNPLLPC